MFKIKFKKFKIYHTIISVLSNFNDGNYQFSKSMVGTLGTHFIPNGKYLIKINFNKIELQMFQILFK